MIAVLAKSSRDYDDFLHRMYYQDRQKFFYVKNVNILRGRDDINDILRLYNWDQREDAIELLTTARIQKEKYI